MTLEEALKTIETLKLENEKLQKRNKLLEDIMYNETMSSYDGYEVDDSYDPIFD